VKYLPLLRTQVSSSPELSLTLGQGVTVELWPPPPQSNIYCVFCWLKILKNLDYSNKIEEPMLQYGAWKKYISELCTLSKSEIRWDGLSFLTLFMILKKKILYLVYTVCKQTKGLFSPWKLKVTLLWYLDHVATSMSREPGECSQYSDWLWAGQWWHQCLIPSGCKIFLLSTSYRMSLRPTYPPIWGALSLGVKLIGHETDHSPPTSAKVKNMWMYTSSPSYVFMA
jgi:hypothetical protein